MAEFLPLDAMNWITRGNALRLDWLGVCPPAGSSVKLVSDDLFQTPLEQAEIDFRNEGGEIYVCGNPPYLGFTWQSAEQKADIRSLLTGRTTSSGFLDYVLAGSLRPQTTGQEQTPWLRLFPPIRSARASPYRSYGPSCSIRATISVSHTRLSSGLISPATRRGSLLS